MTIKDGLAQCLTDLGGSPDSHVKALMASDIPSISSPNTGLSVACAPFTKQNALSLLD